MCLHKCIFANVSVYPHTSVVLCSLDSTSSALQVYSSSSFVVFVVLYCVVFLLFVLVLFSNKILAVLLLIGVTVTKPRGMPGKNWGKDC